MAEMQGELQRVTGSTLDAQGAANLWAGTAGYDLVGALNVKAGTTGLELNAVWQRITGGTGEANAEAASARANLLTVNQASLETDTAGWQANENCTIARSTAQAADGAASLAMTASTIGASRCTTEATRTGILGGQSYAALLSTRAATTARAAQINIHWFDVNQSYMSSAIGTATANSTTVWSERTISATSPATAYYAAIEFKIDDATQVLGEVHYCDKAGLFLGTTATWSL